MAGGAVAQCQACGGRAQRLSCLPHGRPHARGTRAPWCRHARRAGLQPQRTAAKKGTVPQAAHSSASDTVDPATDVSPTPCRRSQPRRCSCSCDVTQCTMRASVSARCRSGGSHVPLHAAPALPARWRARAGARGAGWRRAERCDGVTSRQHACRARPHSACSEHAPAAVVEHPHQLLVREERGALACARPRASARRRACGRSAPHRPAPAPER